MNVMWKNLTVFQIYETRNFNSFNNCAFPVWDCSYHLLGHKRGVELGTEESG